MQIVNILLIIVAVLAVVAGVTTFLGAAKGDRARSAWFFLATVFAALWIMSVLLFQSVRPGGDIDLAVYPACFCYISVLFTDVALLGYITWQKRSGRIITLAITALNVVFSLVVLIKPELFQSDVVITESVNSIVFNVGPIYFTYIILACILTTAVFSALMQQKNKSKSLRIKNGSVVLLVGFAISSLVTLVVDLIITFWDWSYSWLGPLAISATIIAFYYSILRYRVLKLGSRWLRFLSLVVIVASVAIVYMIVFYVVFLAMFRGSNPSTEVIVLNFIMVFFFILLMPAINGTVLFMSSLISGDSGKNDAVDSKPNVGDETLGDQKGQTIIRKKV